MSLRRRLVIAFTVLLLVALAALSVIAARSTTRVLTDQADEDLRVIEERLGSRLVGDGRDLAGAQVDRRFALLVFDAGGSLTESAPSGFADDPDPLPDTDELHELLAAPGSIGSVSSADGLVAYRALAVDVATGEIAVVAVPVDGIGEATDDLVWLLVSGGALVAVVGAAATWWVVRRGLRPVDDMVDTAAAIAAGDLTRRVPEEDPTTELGRLGGALNDMLTQLDDAFERQRTSQDQLNQFVADASHELRTPLAALQGYADLYRQGALEDRAELDSAMERIRKESGRMRRLVEDLLLLARLDRGQPLEVSGVNIASIVSDAIADSRAIEPDRAVTYEGPRRLYVEGDAHRLAQVFANLLANARDHTPAGTPVRITATEQRATTTITVTDFGPGIPDDHLQHVFDRFNRGDPSPTRQRGGAGLGLAIVAAIVDAHDGTIEAANAPGRGASFTITLPVAATHTPESDRQR